MKTKLVLPLDTIEVLDGELEMVLGGFVAMPYGATGGQGCGCACETGSGCGCECVSGKGCGCGCDCASGKGCGCGCSCTTTSSPA